MTLHKQAQLSTTKIWILATRPKTWIASLSPVLLGSAMAMKEGFFQPSLFLFVLLTALGIQISTNLANDYFDFLRGGDTAERRGPVRVTQAGLVSLKNMKRAIFISFILTALLGCFLIAQGGIAIAAILLASLLLGLAYTAGPYPIAYIGLGEGFVLLFFGSIAVAGTYFLQTSLWSWAACFIGLAPGLFSSAILVTNNLRDEKEDRASGKKTLVVRFGRRFGKGEYIFCLLGAMCIPLFFLNEHPLALLALLALPPCLPLIVAVWRGNSAEEFGELLPKTARLLFLYTLLLCVGWML